MTTAAEKVRTASAMPAGLQIMMAVVANEESRFSNLNTRAISLLSATSLITALAGLFSKDILAGSLGGVAGFVAVMLMIVLVGLLGTAAVLVLGVLMPGKRGLFGRGNENVVDPNKISDVEMVQDIAFGEFTGILTTLRERNAEKVRALHRAYSIFLGTVLAIVIGTFGVAVQVVL
ncbi:MAG TPA: hypothetical protein VGP26_14005 [Actinophytocola sp.]|jgi:hypothetical protein|nr:hypothetical protein [Actinophytocola sp.]